MKYRILVVEDIDSIRRAIVELLESRYLVSEAENYNHAVDVLNSEKIDLVITDIKMPGKSGLELIVYIREKFPNILYSLITAYDINQYIHFAKDYNVWNIIPKYSSLDLRYIEVMVEKLLGRDIFGIEKYYPDLVIKTDSINTGFELPPENGFIYKIVKSDEERNKICERVGKFMEGKGAPTSIHQILEELTSNAMIRAPRDTKGNAKYQFELPDSDILVPHKKVRLSENDYFQIGYGFYNNVFLLVTRDYFGTLKKEEIIFRLDRNISDDPSLGFPPGITDSHGRGLFICREMADQMIFNIHKNRQTEVIAILENFDVKPFKSLSIFEVD
ncbi:MAG: response regulator [Leptospiraceae bacterium]|nr:response regulator [Leptospiraceae bacterium]